MADALACGRRFRTFNVVDDFNREALHIEVDTSISSTRLVRIFEQLKRDHGLPQVLRTDNGPEFLGEAFVQWATDSGTTLYPHQDEALSEILEGRHVIAATPTGSGKSMIASAIVGHTAPAVRVSGRIAIGGRDVAGVPAPQRPPQARAAMASSAPRIS